MGPIGWPETSVCNYRSSLRKYPEERRSRIGVRFLVSARYLCFLHRGQIGPPGPFAMSIQGCSDVGVKLINQFDLMLRLRMYGAWLHSPIFHHVVMTEGRLQTCLCLLVPWTNDRGLCISQICSLCQRVVFFLIPAVINLLAPELFF